MKYSTKLIAVLFGISLLFFGGVQAFGQEWSPEQKEVLKMEVKYWDLLKEKNLKGYMVLFHKDFIGWPHWSPKPVGRDGIEKGTLPWYQYVTSYDLKPEAINIFDKFGVIYYHINWIATDAGTISGRMGHFWIKQDGKWLIIGGYSGGANTLE